MASREHRQLQRCQQQLSLGYGGLCDRHDQRGQDGLLTLTYLGYCSRICFILLKWNFLGGSVGRFCLGKPAATELCYRHRQTFRPKD